MGIGPGFIGIGVAAIVVAMSVAAPPAVAQKLDPTDYAGVKMKPGSYLWRPESAPQGGAISIVVSVPLQTAYVYRGEVLIGVTSVSTGKTGHDTPTGVYTILQKDPLHHSNLYDDAPMPFMQRMTWDGLALHGGRLPGYPASHGCVRLPMAFAEILFHEVPLGATVEVTDEVEEREDGGGAIAGSDPAAE